MLIIDTEHTFYLEPTGKGQGVRLVCICGESHGACSWTSWEEALDSGVIHPSHVEEWTTQPKIKGFCSLLAKRHGAVNRARASWHKS